MNIKGIDNLDVGMSNIEIEGEVVYSDPPENKKGISEKTNKPYDFWSQWIVIQDDTGKMGCSVTIEKEEYKLEKGVVARVKGKLKEWKGKRKIEGKLVAISKGDRVVDVQQERAEEYFEEKAKEEKKGEKVIPVKVKVEESVWEAKDLRIARECAVKAVTELAVAKLIEGKEFFPFANTIVKYIYNGKVNGKEKKSILRNDREPLEIISEDAPFPIEEIENAVNEKEKAEGNSYKNALPFKGKRKKVAVVEDFIAPGDMPE